MKRATSKTLKAVINFLEEMAANGAMERGRTKAITKAVRKLRQANQRRDQKAMIEAIDLVARLVLRELE